MTALELFWRHVSVSQEKEHFSHFNPNTLFFSYICGSFYPKLKGITAKILLFFFANSKKNIFLLHFISIALGFSSFW